MTPLAFSDSLHCLHPETTVAINGVWCEGPKEASQVASSLPDFINLIRKFLLSSSELQCSSPPGSLPGSTLGPVILHCPRMELPVPAQFGQG